MAVHVAVIWAHGKLRGRGSWMFAWPRLPRPRAPVPLPTASPSRDREGKDTRLQLIDPKDSRLWRCDLFTNREEETVGPGRTAPPARPR